MMRMPSSWVRTCYTPPRRTEVQYVNVFRQNSVSEMSTAMNDTYLYPSIDPEARLYHAEHQVTFIAVVVTYFCCSWPIHDT